MSNDEKRPYDLHPDHPDEPERPESPSERPESPPELPESPPEPEQRDHDREAAAPKPAAEAPARRKRVEPCPNCGAPMTGSDALVCVRCGFDLKTLKVLRTTEAQAEAAEEGEEEEEEAERRVLSPPGRGGDWLPIGIAAGCALVLVVGYLAGASGLFPAESEVASESGEMMIRIGERFTEMLRFAVLALVLVGCGMLALLGLALLWGAELGDVRLALLRVAAIVLAMRLAAFASFSRRSVEWTVEMLLQAAILVGLSMLLLRLNPRDSVLYALLVLVSLGALWVAGQAVTWVL